MGWFKKSNKTEQLIGNRQYTEEYIVTSNETITESIDKLDIFLNQEFKVEYYWYDCFQDIIKQSGINVYNINFDENAENPIPITDFSTILSDTNLISISDEYGKPIFKQGSILPIASNIIKVTNYNNLTGEITLNFEPKVNFRVNFKIKYNRKDVPTGKVNFGSVTQVIIDNQASNEAIEITYDNTNSKLSSIDVQNSLDEIVNLTKYNSFGIEVLPTLTKNPDGTVTIGSDGVIIFNTQSDGKGLKKRFANVTGTTLTIPDNTTSYIYCDYNNGTPIYAFTTSPAIFLAEARYTPVLRVTRESSTILHFAEYDQYAVELSNKALYKDIALHGFERQTGLILSTSPTRIVTLSAGFAWLGVQSFTLAQIVSGTTGDVYEYYLTAGVWGRSLVTSYDASYYSDGTNRLALNNNKWVSKYFFRDVGSDIELYYIHGNEYNSQAEALAEALPTAPSTLTSHALYVGKIVIQKDATNGTAYPRAWDKAIQSATVTEHNNLANIQGGSVGEYYHITNTQASAVAGLETPLQPLLFDESINGIPDNEKSKWGLSYNATTRVFTLTITGSNTYYYVNGRKFTLAVGTYNFTAHANTSGIYYFYFTNNGVATTSATVLDILTTCQIAYVYYNATNVAGLLGYELHGCNMSSWSHMYHHMTDGTKFGSGGALSGYTIQSDVLANVKFGMDSAIYYDEDIQLVSDALVDGSNYNIITRNASGEWAWITSTTPYLNTIGGTNNPRYNQSGTSLTEITTNNTYFNYYVILTNFVGTGNKVFLISGQSIYTSLANAQAESITNLNLGGLPFQEFVILWQITYRYNTGYSTTTAKTRIEAQPIRVTTNRASLAGFTGSHNALSGRADVNSHPISAINATIPNAVIFEKSDGLGLGESLDITWNDTTKILSSKNITTEKLNELTFAKQTNGFTIVGGTTSKTLTVANDANISGTNTGDQTSIVGITGTITQFNTALTDGDFATLAGSETLTNKTLTSPVINTSITGTAITVTGEASKVVKTNSLGDIYERGFRVAEDFKAMKDMPIIYLNGIGSSVTISDNSNFSFTDNTSDRPFAFIEAIKGLKSGNTTRYLKTKGSAGQYEYVLFITTLNTVGITLYSADGTKTLKALGNTVLPDDFSGRIGITYDGTASPTSLEIYINGIKDTVTITNTGTYTNMTNGTASLLLGNLSGTGFVQIEYSMSRIFNRRLTQDEFQRYSYSSLPYSEIGASNVDLTLGNGSFATDTTGWWDKARGTLTWNSGTQDATFTADGTAGYASIRQYLLVAGKRYRLSFNAKSTNLASSLITTDGNISARVNPILSATYQNYVFEGVATAQYFGILFGNNLANGITIVIDDIVIQQIGNVLDLSSDSIANTGWFDKSGNNLHATYTNALPFNLQNYKPRVQNYSVDMRGANVASATTITPSGELFHVTGTTAIATINVPYTNFNGSIIIIPDGIFTWTTAGNIALAGTAVVSKALRMTYDATTSKWYPDYIS